MELDVLRDLMDAHLKNSVDVEYDSDPLMDIPSNRITSIDTWWDEVKDAAIPMPATTLIAFPYKTLQRFVECLELNKDPVGAVQMMESFVNIAAKELEHGPIFIKSFHYANKHGCRDTAVRNRKEIFERYADIAYASLCHGLPVAGWAIRRFIPLHYTFRAFSGFPVGREMRIFVRRGEVVAVNPYWPEHSIQFDGEEPEGWREKLAELNAISYEDEGVLRSYALTLYCRVMEIHDYWSFDFAYGQDGQWYFIDAAMGEASYGAVVFD